jgi:hypothetical protein
MHEDLSLPHYSPGKNCGHELAEGSEINGRRKSV